ncbi:MAG: ABC transporter ATP-binding protein [Chloroflexi bacterium RBG_13_53_26]|nr:MAG: ABC transporter ATP-binding protein [Chloroflexi bacterium RBG_13_53_26]
MLQIQGLSVETGGKEILRGINLFIGTGETHVLFGPNGSGKTTLLMAIMGFPRYKITRGRIIFKGHDITNASLDERARLGIGMSFQRPPVVRGVKMRDMVSACLGSRDDGTAVAQLAERLNMGDLMDRDVNYGFSGGEIKRSELLQLLVQEPDLTLLDEPESGVDLVNIALIGEMINELLQKNLKRNRTRAGLIITHTGHILDYVHASKGYVLIDGTVRCERDARECLDSIKKHGYEGCATCLK